METVRLKVDWQDAPLDVAFKVLNISRNSNIIVEYYTSNKPTVTISVSPKAKLSNIVTAYSLGIESEYVKIQRET